MTHLRQLFFTLLLLGLQAAGLCAGNAEVSKVHRVISQAVGTDELLVALAEPEQILCLSGLSRNAQFSAVAEEAKRYPQFPLNADAEAVVKMSPTLVLFAFYSRAELIAQVRRAGVKVLIFQKFDTLEDSYANLRMLAAEIGAEAKAERIIAACEKRVAALRLALNGRRPVKVIAPSTFGVIPGAESTFQDLCDHAGAENLASSLGKLKGHAAPPAESMITWPIEQLVVGANSKEEGLSPFRSLPPYRFMASVKEGRAVVLKPHLLSCVSHYRVDGYEALARALHPEAFSP